MSISTGPIGASATASLTAGEGLQHSAQRNQKTAQSAGTSSAPVESFNPPAVAAKVADVVKPGTEQIRQSLRDINQVLATWSISVQFQIDPDFKDVIIKVVDQESGKLIRQIPTEDVVRISKAMDNLKGLLFAQSV